MDLGLKDNAPSSRLLHGLGFATAITLAREGYKVAVNSRRRENAKAAAEKITNETGTQAFGMVGDVSDSMHRQNLIQSAVDVLGGLDILITNARRATRWLL